MSLVQSNNSSWLPNINSKSKSNTKADAYIMGGYDYFDVGQLHVRSEMASRAQSQAVSRAISRAGSQVNLAKIPSFKNVDSAHSEKPPTVGRLLSLQTDL